MTNKHRKEFETKLLKHMPHANLDFDGEGYTSAWVQAAWTGWNFSVQSLREQSQIQEVLQDRVQELEGQLESLRLQLEQAKGRLGQIKGMNPNAN